MKREALEASKRASEQRKENILMADGRIYIYSINTAQHRQILLIASKKTEGLPSKIVSQPQNLNFGRTPHRAIRQLGEEKHCHISTIIFPHMNLSDCIQTS